jgi:hypothetical protein
MCLLETRINTNNVYQIAVVEFRERGDSYVREMRRRELYREYELHCTTGLGNISP